MFLRTSAISGLSLFLEKKKLRYPDGTFIVFSNHLREMSHPSLCAQTDYGLPNDVLEPDCPDLFGAPKTCLGIKQS